MEVADVCSGVATSRGEVIVNGVSVCRASVKAAIVASKSPVSSSVPMSPSLVESPPALASNVALTCAATVADMSSSDTACCWRN